jgi:hypothetical protein
VAEILNRLQAPRFLQLYRGVEEAMDAVFARPPFLRDELLLAPTLSAPAAARAFVQRVCDYWEPALPDSTLADRAVLLASELVTNAVVHARTDLRLRLELRGDWLHLAVRDASPRLLQVVASDLHAPGAAGCGWSSSSPPPGGSTATPTAARSSGAPSSSNHPGEFYPRAVICEARPRRRRSESGWTHRRFACSFADEMGLSPGSCPWSSAAWRRQGLLRIGAGETNIA